MNPVPKEPWVLKQSWNDLLFAHWPVAQIPGTAIAKLGDVEVGDRQPGKSPRIESGPDTMTFRLRIDSYDGQLIELVVTCHRTGEMFAALRLAKDPDARS